MFGSVNEENEWVVKKVVLEHLNHIPTLCKVRYISKYRRQEVNTTVRRRLFNDTAVGVSVSKIHRSLAMDNNGLDNLAVTERDLRNILAKERRLKLGEGDANAMLSYFSKMTEDNQNFFHMHRLDAFGYLKDVLWVDARSRAAYEEFGDVVCFDVTYLTNDYDLPFANFVGVNHHGQTILLGCALVSHETIETYEWVFRTWLMCMNGKAPSGFLTDQDAAMRRALANCMPDTWHRWCLWHILTKFSSKLGMYTKYQDIKVALHNAIYDSLNDEEFEKSWGDAIAKFDLGSDNWLAGMKTTQRSESINSFFDGYVHKNTRLCDFVEKYCCAMEARANSEEKLMQTQWRKNEEIEENVFEHTFTDRLSVVCKTTREDVPLDNKREYKVKVDMNSNEAYCECKLLECHGIMCPHLILLYDKLNVKEIPQRYILRRWQKDVIRKHTMVKVAY
ncbi:protein FAR-RED IMPAIRED RESPONSE 1-like [Beta vulgaris subsp. vulgaris]|uniref:protein FAR-RED IMPAIRED RESPONSE 1-like n=1 Tax=Beta vulgaris subsp. vulgaris TaxID=3555 RepID=UPI0020368A45|nr:protein FAR-RED IMPAIRED RESPONSE 1-like [Beta vulgaris subsp. vulgaris]